MNGERVTQTVRCCWLGNGTTAARFLACVLDGILADVLTRHVAWKEPVFRFLYTPPVTQDYQQPRRQHHVAILLAFALIDADHHSCTIDVRYLEANRFGDSQAGRVAGGQDGPMLVAADTLEKLEDFFRAQNDGQFLWFLGCRDDILERPVLLQRNLVEK